MSSTRVKTPIAGPSKDIGNIVRGDLGQLPAG